ncbi:hypothetical protein GRX03_09575 [Halovenus sp. WSH3]|uniref:HTH bat-type domain-containing protein n=1 Tax=Halovenus carboxidivorans TaxID=2692199 RepID=A0A6B0T1E7_9EURY|nr:helix-turn-helix domain-containing protein [Halovenus carboxidivorans]MXR51854.1 hypothetical protein [Halovenus carboxidivorans]
MTGTHAQLSVSPRRECPLRDVVTEYSVQTFVPAGGETPPQVVIEESETAVSDDPTVEAVAAGEQFVVCRLPSETDADPIGRLCDGSRCLAEGFEHLPVRPYALTWDEKWLQLLVAAPGTEAVQECVQQFEAVGLSASVEALSSDDIAGSSQPVLIDLDVLTARQQEVARLAVERGYYDCDGASAAALAAELDISQATLSEHLRAVRAKLGPQIFVTESD